MVKQIFGQLCLSYPKKPLEHDKGAKISMVDGVDKDSGKPIPQMNDPLLTAPDWGVVSYGEADQKTGNPELVVTKLETGDVVGMFNRIAKGNVLWEGEIDLEHTNYHYGLQAGLSRRTWSSMFMRKMPAVLTREGQEFHGALEPFSEFGLEGVAWEFMEFGYSGYASLRGISNGDHLSVYKQVTHGNEDWCGRLSFSNDGKPLIHDRQTFARDVKHMPVKDWLQLTHEKRPVVLTKNLG